MVILAITSAGSASAHGDPASHYLETDALYPSFARQPSVEVQLQLLGLLQATERRGYPVKVALVAGTEDLVEDLTPLKTPQRYANTVASTIQHDLDAPVLVVTPFGLGVAGNAARNGVLRPITPGYARRLVRGLRVPGDGDGDALARAAMAAVRRIARAGDHPLPARVAPAEPVTASVATGPAAPVPVERGGSGGGGGSLLWLFAAALVPLALLWAHRRSRRPAASEA